MSPRQEAWLTWILCGACGAVVAAAFLPRLFPAAVPVVREQGDVVVSVGGAINWPGVYELPWGSRVGDLVDAAGGLRPDAEESMVNAAMPLDTGMSVIVPSKRTETGEERISLNSASKRELELLPGIGPVLAERIIAARPFFGVDELVKVPGVGPITMERVRPLIRP